jgi:hypothetical protein
MLKLLVSAAATTVLAASAPVVRPDPTATRVDDTAVAAAEPTVPGVVEPVAVEVSKEARHLDATAARPSVGLHPEIRIVGASAAEAAAVDEALGRFRDAGLLLPDASIVFHDDQEACGGHDGLFQARYTPWRVLVCSDLGYVVTHELAHAWEAANLDDADRDRYVEHRGLATWDSGDAGWGARGVEDAAFIVQQNLTARGARVDSAAWRERIEAFELLTGLPSPLSPNQELAG